MCDSSTGSLHWKPLLEASTRSLYWKSLLEASTGSFYWKPPLEASTGSLHWKPPLEASTGSLHWKLLLEASIGSLHWKPPLEASTLLETSTAMYLLYHVNLTHLSLQQRLGNSGVLIFRVLSTYKKLVQLREEEGALCVRVGTCR